MRAASCTVLVALCGIVVLSSRPATIAAPQAAPAPVPSRQRPVVAPAARGQATLAAPAPAGDVKTPATQVPAYQAFLSPASPLQLVAAKKVDRLAWIAFEQGRRNAYTAAAPAFVAVRLTSFVKDDGIDMSAIQISDDGGTVVFVRGSAQNRDGWVANPTANPDGPDRAVWAVRTAGGAAWRVVALDTGTPELAPDGSSIVFVKEGQIHRATVSPVRPASEMDRGEKPFIREWGVQSAPAWSPDGRKLAFVSTRTDHSFIAVYDMATRTVKYMSPSVDFDSTPLWTADGKSIVFVRRPGLPFGQQAQPGAGAIGLPPGPAYQPGAASGRGRGAAAAVTAPTAVTAPPEPAVTAPGATAGTAPAATAATAPGATPVTTQPRTAVAAPPGQQQPGQPAAGARGQGRQGQFPSLAANLAAMKVPGLMRATFRGGYTWSLWKADVATGDAREVWHNQPDDLRFATAGDLRLAGDYLVFRFNAGGGRGGGRGAAAVPAPIETPPAPTDEWDRYHSLNLSAPSAQPALLTTTDGLIEDQGSVALSPDAKMLYYCTNATDIERRHIWAVAVDGSTPPWLVTRGTGIETRPTPLASGTWLATLSADWRMPQSLGLWSFNGAPLARGLILSSTAAQKIVFPTERKGFPADRHVEPQLVVTTAADGLEIHNQLFLPKDIKPGEKRAAIVFVHGGPVRQMLLGYHYMQFYHWAYAINQWLASQGYVVMSINYRLGIGYGRSFRAARNGGGAGNSEYQDVVAGAKYLQSRPDVDANRIGIWGLSYGGVLTSQALARNSDIFKAGVDLAGVHLWGSSLDPDAVSYASSTIGAIDGWRSPVLLVHGDDDRNVAFQQTTGLVQLLRQRDVYYELIVFPDDTHESLLFSRWMYTLARMETFLKKFLQPGGRTS